MNYKYLFIVITKKSNKDYISKLNKCIKEKISFIDENFPPEI
jgi:hypothetical protein